ncbi:MAG: hypothetical protein ACRCZJ_03435 [Erysipelotrichaceae bacterium]
MKLQWKKWMFSSVLTLLLLMTIFGVLALFVSGPNRQYEAKINEITTKIKTVQPDASVAYDVYRYATYIASDIEGFIIYDANGDFVLQRSAAQIDFDTASARARSDYQVEATSIAIGYGYKNAVYKIKAEGVTLFLDFDTLELVSYYEGEL